MLNENHQAIRKNITKIKVFNKIERKHLLVKEKLHQKGKILIYLFILKKKKEM